MALFDKQRSNTSESIPLYTLGNNKTLLVLGLGNVGKEYDRTRHNVGFMTLDRYQQSHEFSSWMEKKDLQCHISSGNIGATRVLLIKPTTMMNLSGEALQRVQHFYKLSSSDTVVVYDDLDIDFGVIRTRSGGSSAGHNGIKSLLEHTDDTFGRIRVGIGPKKPARMATADFVLKNFNDEQQQNLTKIIKEACVLLDERTVGQLPDHTITVL